MCVRGGVYRKGAPPFCISPAVSRCLCISVWVEAGYPLRRYARLVGAPNCAPSLRSVAGLLLALALQSAYEDTLPLPYRVSKHTIVRSRDSRAISKSFSDVRRCELKSIL